MRIESVAMRMPSLLVTNDWIIEQIREANRYQQTELIEKYCQTIRRLFAKSGAKYRYIRDKQNGERAFDLLIEAIRSAMSAADLRPKEIGLIIYCGVGRGFLEPANGAFVARALGISCDNFDVNEACMSWVRSLQLSYDLLRSRRYTSVLIVNSEFTVYEHGIPGAFKIHSEEQLRYTYPSLTIGEGATATIVIPSKKHWNFRFKAAPLHAPLCHLPLPGFHDFCEPDARLGLNGPHQLVAFGSELSRVATTEMVSFVQECYPTRDNVDIWIPHNTSEPDLNVMEQRLGLEGKLFKGMFRRYGNLISASIPATLVMAQQTGVLQRGSRIVLCPATAGMAFGLVEGEF